MRDGNWMDWKWWDWKWREWKRRDWRGGGGRGRDYTLSSLCRTCKKTNIVHSTTCFCIIELREAGTFSRIFFNQAFFADFLKNRSSEAAMSKEARGLPFFVLMSLKRRVVQIIPTCCYITEYKPCSYLLKKVKVCSVSAYA
jgi:hypothetical protein